MPKRVLLIDDRPIVLNGIKDELIRRVPSGLEIDTARNFFFAINHLSRSTYDVISLDLNMPRIKTAKCFDELSGTTLNGWLFLKHYIFRDGADFKSKCANTKIFIFSGYIEELRLHIRNLSSEQKEQTDWFSTLDLVYKGNGEYQTIAENILSVLGLSK